MTVMVATVVGMTTTQPDFKLNCPGALIAALPAILGFVPEKSLVLLTISDGELGSIMRVDLRERLADTLGQLAEVAAAADPAAAIAVIIDADCAYCPVCNEQHRQWCTVLTEELSGRGIVLWAAHVVDRVAPGGRWRCVDGCGAGGLVDDPSASPLAAAAVLEGRRLYPRRADLQAVIAEDPSGSPAVAAAISEQAGVRAAAHRADPEGRARRDVEDMLAAAAAVAADRRPAAAELATLGCALGDVTVRDTLFGLAVSESAAAAEALWALLARTLPTPWRAEALVLLAFSAYARGDGPLAGISLEAALRAAPQHRMAGMLDTALQSGLRPERIRQLANTGYRLARGLGVRLPPRQELRRRAG